MRFPTFLFILLLASPLSQLSSQILDSDHNGLWDEWERTHFSTIGIDPTHDHDGDCQNALFEMLAGTNPNRSDSKFSQSIQASPHSQRISISPLTPNRIYTTYTTQTPQNAQSWKVLAESDSDTLQATKGIIDYTDLPYPTFYKISIRPQYTGTIYYLSNQGNDSNDGRSPQTSWKTIDHLNTQSLSPGDAVLFKRGDTWRETLRLSDSGTDEHYITYSAYGQGERPRFLGSEQAMEWVPVENYPNVWKSNTSLPDPFDSYPAELWFEEHDNTVSWGTHSENGYATLSGLEEEYDVAYSGNHIYIYCPEDPSLRYRSVEVALRTNVIELEDKEHITIDQLTLRYAISRGIYENYSPSPDLSGLRITHCEVGYFGVKDGPNMYGLSLRHSNMYIAHNEIHDCGRRSISIHTYDTTPVTALENVIIEKNHFHHGYHTTGVDSINTGPHTIQNITIRYNRFEGDPSVELGGINPNSNHIFIANQSDSGYVGNFHIYGNIFTHTQGGAILLESVDEVNINHNTFYGFNPTLNDFHSMVGIGGGNALNISIKNNIFYTNADESFFTNLQCLYIQSSTEYAKNFSAEIDNNLYFSDDPNAHITRFYRPGAFHAEYTTAEWSEYTQEEQFDLNSPSPSDPMFAAANYGDFRLLEGSPAIHAGEPIDGITHDINGHPYDPTTPSLGAYAYQEIEPLTFYKLNLNNGLGSISSNPEYDKYLAGTSVQVHATSSLDYVFSHWSGSLTGNQNPANITMDSNKSIQAIFIRAPTDTQAPTTPQNIRAHDITDGSARLSWDTSTDNVVVDSYTIYRDGTSIATTTESNYHDQSLSPSTTYQYTIVATDHSKNSSEFSPLLTVNTLDPNIGTTYYISNSGNDNNDGHSPETPWKSIEKANSQTFSPGDSILFKRGDIWHATLEMNASGTAFSPIRFAAYGSESLPKPRLTGSISPLEWEHVNELPNLWRTRSDIPNPFDYYGSELWFESHDRSVIWGNHYENYEDLTQLNQEYNVAWVDSKIYVYSPENPSVRYKSIEVPIESDIILLQNHENLVFDQLSIRYARGRGINEVYSPSQNLTGLTITNCEIGYFGQKNGANMYGLGVRHSNMYIAHNEIHDCGRRAISLHTYATDPVIVLENVVIEHNHFHHGYHTTGVDSINTGNHTIRNVTIRYNHFEGDPHATLDNTYTPEINEGDPNSNHIFIANQGGGYVGQFHIYGNLFTHAHGSSIKLEEVDSIEIIHNTFYGFNPTLSNIQSHIYTWILSDLTITNNIFVNTAPSTEAPYLSCLKLDNPYLGEFTVDNNLYYTPNSGAWLIRNHGGSHLRTSQWTSFQSETGFDPHSPTPADPLFVDPENGDFRLLENSPAIAAGTPINGITHDYSGTPFSSNSPSLGALQYQD